MTPAGTISKADLDTPLCVDLDGTLVSVDTLHESLLRLARRSPIDLTRLPAWWLAGRAQLKRRVASRVPLDAARLPYRENVLRYLREERAKGRRVILATASDQSVADAVAEHLGLFDAAIGSDGEHDLKGAAKLAGLRGLLGEASFEYIGDSDADRPVWEAASRRGVVAPSAALRRRLEALDPGCVVFAGVPGPRSKHVLAALRPIQWTKNLLLFVPLFTAHRWSDWTALGLTAVAFLAFCLVASAGYVLNDLLDLDADREHERKRGRPFANGALTAATGVACFVVLAVTGVVLAACLLPTDCVLLLILYLLTAVGYSLWFKQKLLLDVMILAGLYTLRVLAGGLATGVWVSEWLLAFAMFMFLSLAVAKRYCELTTIDPRSDKLVRRGYHVADMDLMLITGTTSGFLSVLIFSLYINSAEVELLYAHKDLLWLACPVMLYWILRIWFLARRGEMPEDPVAFAVRDRNSLVVALLLSLVILAATS
ncbi:MAG: UbiA family prenyltransferase [Planctomycetes bacterium]|nr:UbiA family prenyltransferase [Planctomycetota bacterium]